MFASWALQSVRLSRHFIQKPLPCHARVGAGLSRRPCLNRPISSSAPAGSGPRGAPSRAGARWRNIGASLAAAAAAVVGGSIFVSQSSLGKEGEEPKNKTAYKDSSLAPVYASRKELDQAISELAGALGDDAVSTADEDLHQHGFSEWSTVNIDSSPVAVVYPKSTDDVVKIARIAYKYRVPMIPFSGGTSLEGNFTAPFGGLSIDFAYMDKVLALNADDMDVVVQPAVPWMALNEQIKESGLFFPIDPGPTAKFGGMVGTNCSGTNAVRYGTMKDWVINVTAVLADGTVIKTRRRPRKSAAGYNLTSLFVGSEGTLGLVTEITLKLAVLPEQTSVAVATFPTIKDATAAAIKVLRAGIPIAALELMDEVQMQVINQTGSTNRTWKETPTMFFKFSGTKAGVQENIKLVKAISRATKGDSFKLGMSAEEQAALWSARKESFWAMLALRKEGDIVFSTDVAVPISKLPDLIEISKTELDSLGLLSSILGHVGDGNFHEMILYNGQDARERDAVKACVQRMVSRAIALDGTCTGEHGVGLGKKESLVEELGLETVGVMRSIKRALDPLWLMNPGKIIDSSDLE